MRFLKNKIEGSDFFSNLLTLMSGSLIALILSFIASPILTRLYSPESFGLMSMALATTVVTIKVVTLRYEEAVMLPKNDYEALNLVILASCLASVFITLSVLIIHFTGKERFFSYFQAQALEPYFILLIMDIIFSTYFQILTCYLNRKKNYKDIATNKVMGSLALNLSGIIFGLKSIANGLVIARAISTFIMMVIALFSFLKTKADIGKVNIVGMKKVAVKYQSYPKLKLLSDIIGSIADKAHIAIFFKFFGSEVVGIIALASSIILVPLSVFAQSFSQIFYQKISEIDDNQRLFEVYKKSLLNLTPIALSLIVTCFLLPADLFTFVFGKNWSSLKMYIFPLSFWFAAQFLYSSLSTIYLKLDLMRSFLIFNIANIIIVFSSIYSGFYYKLGAYGTLKLFSIVLSGFYLYMCFHGFYIIRKTKRKENKCVV